MCLSVPLGSSRRDLSCPGRGNAAMRCRPATRLARPGGRSGRCEARHGRTVSRVTSRSGEPWVDRRPRVRRHANVPGHLSACANAGRRTRAQSPPPRSRTVRETSTSLGIAMAPTRAPTCTLNPVRSRPVRSSSPACTPARTEMPSSSADLRISSAHRTAWVGPSNRLNVPSPVTLMSRPPLCSAWSRTCRSCVARSARYSASPIRASNSVDPTTSVNSIVRKNRSASGGCRAPVAASSICSQTGIHASPMAAPTCVGGRW
jgi:hypothetical protein